MTNRYLCSPICKRFLPRLQAEENGQSLVIFSLFLTILIGILGLVLDMGYGVARQRQMQLAADTAAMSGAYDLAQGRSASVAVTRMGQVLVANGADSALSTFTVSSGNVTDVRARSTVNTLFSSIFGIDAFPVSARARAAAGQVNAAINLMPFVVQENQWVPGQSVQLWAGGSGGAGNSGWVAWRGYSKSDLATLISDPTRSGNIVIGDRIPAVTGVSFNPLVGALAGIVNQVVIVILYDPRQTTGTGSNLTYRVRGFAHFLVTGYVSAGSDSRIIGRFVLQSDSNVTFGGTINPGVNIGVQGVAMLE